EARERHRAAAGARVRNRSARLGEARVLAACREATDGEQERRAGARLADRADGDPGDGAGVVDRPREAEAPRLARADSAVARGEPGRGDTERCRRRPAGDERGGADGENEEAKRE